MKIIKQCIKAFYRMSHFGFLVTFFDYFFEITKSYKINQVKHNAISRWLQKRFKNFIREHYEDANTSPQGDIPKQIWICWWDGVENMPPIVKACYNSVVRNAIDFKITLITKYNYTDYLSIPDYIMEKVNNGKMTLTHFSNIVRVALLYNYGGLWLDATYLITSTLKIDSISFFTIRTINYDGRNIAKGRWQGNCIASAPNFHLFRFIYEFLLGYWKNYNYLITYHLYDYSLNLAYESFPSVKDLFNSIGTINKNDILTDHLKEEYDPIIYNEALNNTTFHKLSWKRVGETKTSDNKLTFYGFILKEYFEV